MPRERFTFDLYPSLDSDHRVACSSGACRHCPLSSKSMTVAQEGFADEIYTTLAEMTAYLDQSEDSRLGFVNIASPVDAASIDRPLPLARRGFHLLSYPLPDCDPAEFDDFEAFISSRLNSVKAMTPVFPKAKRQPYLTLSKHVSLEENGTFANYENSVLQFALFLRLAGPFLRKWIDPRHLSFFMGMNDVPPAIFKQWETLSGRLGKLVEFSAFVTAVNFRNRLALQERTEEFMDFEDDCLKLGAGMGVEYGEELPNEEFPKLQAFQIYGRFIKYRPPRPFTDLDFDPSALAFFPNDVWVSHSTRFVADERLHISHDEFRSLIGKARTDRRLLADVLRDRFLS